MLKRLDLIGRSRILERVQLYVREVTRPSFSGRLKGVACETIHRVQWTAGVPTGPSFRALLMQYIHPELRSLVYET